MSTFGTTSVGGAFNGGHTALERNVQKMTLTEDGYVYSVSHYLRAGSSSQTIRPLIYDDTAGAPGAFHAAGIETIVRSTRPDGWLEQFFTSEVLLTAGTYWIGSWTGSTNFQIKKAQTASGGDNRSNFLDAYSSTANPTVDPFGSTVGHNQSSNLSVYATYVATTANPVNYVDPLIYGTTVVGSLMSVARGSWAGNVSGYTYQWKRDGSNIAAATSSTYIYQSADVGHSLTCAVTATNTNGSTTEDTVTIASGYANWSPVYQQYDDPDTIWLFDADAEKAAYLGNVGVGGLVDTTGQAVSGGSTAACDPWRVGSSFAIETGKFLSGVRGVSGTQDLFMPGVHVPSNSFTVEAWFTCDTAWSATAAKAFDLLNFGSSSQGGDNTASCKLIFCTDASTGAAVVIFQNRQVSPAQTATITDTLVPGAGDHVGVSATYDGTTLTMYRTVNGGTLATVGSATISAPFIWSANDRETGLRLLKGKNGVSNKWVISDIRISRVCRTPGTAVPVSATNTVTISDTPTGDTINPLLRGSVHEPAVDNAVTTALCAANVGALRTGNAMEACPMKAGSTDATHPTIGDSGSYSYDWRPLDHTLDFYASMGIPIYFGLSGTPKILGGTHDPFTPTQCADSTYLITQAQENNQVPNDFAAMGVIAADMYQHIISYNASIGAPDPAGWTFWNEPDGTWQGTMSQHNQCFAAVCNAVKAADPTAYFGGPEVSTIDAVTDTTWTSSLIQYCAANSVDIDFVSYHPYSGDVGGYKWAKTKVADYVTTYSYPRALDLIVTEWGWNSSNLYGSGLYPWHDVANMWFNDWAASFDASALVAGQEFGVEAMYYYAAQESETSDTGFNATGLYSETRPWTSLNVMEMWRRLGE